MSWRSDGKKGRSYHHGNLREALVQAAMGLIAKKGPVGFTFAEAARQAGVSAAAPYRHFRDRDALVLEVAGRGFEKFAKVLDDAWAQGEPDAYQALKRTGAAYLDFARREPALYAAMFESGVPHGEARGVEIASEKAFAVLRAAAEGICANVKTSPRPPAMMVALHIWSLSHGIASLFGRGDRARRALPMPAEDLLEAGMLVYLQGLGLKV